jgi:hypothetical protein
MIVCRDEPFRAETTLWILIATDISRVIELADAYNVEKCELLAYLGQDDSLLINDRMNLEILNTQYMQKNGT